MTPAPLPPVPEYPDPLAWDWESAAPRTFRVLRIVWPQVVHLQGLGRVWLFCDVKHDRAWARRCEG